MLCCVPDRSLQLDGDAVTERPPIYMSTPDVGPLEEAFALDAIRSGWVAPTGPHLAAFEQEMAERCDRTYGVGLSSGTAALHLALLEAGVAPGSVVLVPTLTFIATANAVLYTGATPVFVDCEPKTGNLDPEVLEEALRTLAREGTRVAAVITVDLLGKCVDYNSVMAVCNSYAVPVIEDAAEALGAEYAGRAAGAFGISSALSFNGNKIMTTSGGGLFMTDDARLADRVRYRSTQARQPVAHYEHTEMGFNYRLSNVLAAIGRAQLQRLDEMVDRRRILREHYVELFNAAPGVEIFQRVGDKADNCWLTAILVRPEDAGWQVSDLAQALLEDRIECRRLWKPMHQQPVFSTTRSFLTGAADRLFSAGLTMPSGSALTPDELERIDQALGSFLESRPS
jgi:dTDP-4-amino-4,6-dideoxygalactose transaminase